MNTTTKLSIASVIGVRDGIDQIFSLINEYLESYSQDTENTGQLESCRTYVHQLSGLLEMLELTHVSFVCSKMEKLIDALMHQKIDPQPLALKALLQTSKELLHYLCELIDGAEDNPRHLFPAYRNLMQALGVKNVSESDLFCTNKINDAPLPETLSSPAATEISTTAKQARAKYQAGLLKWLRDPGNQESMQQMISAVSLIEKFPGSLEQRSFWWVCSGFLECLLDQKTTLALPVRRLCGKIEQEIRRLAEKKPLTTESFLPELLDYIAQSDIDSGRIRDIKRTYQLQSQPISVNNQSENQRIAAKEKSDAALQAMRQILKKINENWRHFSVGNRDSQISLLQHIEKLKESATQINFPPLEKLIGVMGGAITYLRIRPQDINDDVAVEIATALLLIENAITDFYRLPTDFSEQVETLSKRLRMITTGKQQKSGLPGIPGPDEIAFKTQEKKTQQQVAQEILANLSLIEGILDRFFVNPTIRTELPKLAALFKQTSGVLVMLNLERANTLLNHCHDLVNKFINPEYKINPPEQVRLADGLSSLGFYIESLSCAHPDNDKILEAALALFNNQPIPETLSPKTADPADVTVTEVPKIEETAKQVDSELLNTFLTEADEVLQEIEESLEICQDEPSNQPSLAALRRGFHTLKGSGRMVELHAISEVAWHMEQVLNRWLSERKPASQHLIDLLTQAHHEFRQWCDVLKKNGTISIKPDNLLLLAKNLIDSDSPLEIAETDKNTSSPVLLDEETLQKDNLENAANASITLGDLNIAHDLFNVFTAEANQHLATLTKELEALMAHPDRAFNPQFMRAAHTLSSTSRALGLTFIADLASSLEQWSSLLLKNFQRLDEAGIQQIKKIVNCLDNMLKSVAHQQLPKETERQTAKALSDELTSLITQEKHHAETKPSDVASTPMKHSLPSTEIPVGQQTNLAGDQQDQQFDSINKLDPVLAPVFFEEARELVPEIGKKLRAWRILPQDDSIHKAILRALHTLKGSAHMAGAVHLGEMIHNMESGVENAISTSIVSVTMIENLETEFDSISERIERLQHAAKTEKQIAVLQQKEVEVSNNAATLSSLEVTEKDLQPNVDKNKISQQKTVLRVNEELIDRLVNESGEISIIRSKVEAQLYNFKQSMLDLGESAERLRRQLREIEIQAESQMQSRHVQQEVEEAFDPLEFDRFTRFQELTRLMAESVDDVVTVQQNLRAIHNAAEAAVTQQALMSRQLQQALMQIRTVPFGNYAEHFYRIVRQLARDLNKKANLVIEEDEVEIDRSILEKINSPIDHLLRNAVAHGLEEPATRLAHNKPETGQITINLQQEGNEVIITLSDDGNGLDLARIREQALRLKLINAEDQLDNDQLMSLIFSHGLTTVDEANGTAGRGIGMDVVKNEIASLGGRVEIHSESGQGTTFRIYLPLTLTVAQTLLVRANDNTYAVPTVIVKQVLELNADELDAAYNNLYVKYNEQKYPFAYLLHLFGETGRTPKINRHNRILLLQSETYQLALHVDELIGNSEVVVKNIGPQMAHAPGVEGATVLGDGEIILIINPVKLMQRDETKKLFISPPSAHRTNTEHHATLPTIMVVDDSLTVRKVTSRLLERKGCEVLIAKDGVGAVNLLRETIPDVMLVDLEMPHMNGFELIRNVRNNPDTQHLPIIIISSRTADKHRKMAEELGVNVFLGKPYNEEELLNHIMQFTNKYPRN